MNSLYIDNFISNQKELFDHLMQDIEWLQITEARKEYFFSNIERSYTYGKMPRTYHSRPYTTLVKSLETKLNETFKTNYDICFLNRYDDKKSALNWHADDSFGMNLEHPIAVISLGFEREIWWKLKNHIGIIPTENKQLLKSGSLFIMPSGFQQEYLHKIPKCDRACSTRISLTFRNYKT